MAVAAAAVSAAGVGAAAPARRADRLMSPAAGDASASQDHQLTQLGPGVRVVTEAMPSVRSVALGLWVGSGSRVESDAQAGLSHLIEHLLFRGSARFDSLEIDQIFDGMGAELNAATGRELTSYYARVMDVHLPRAFEVLADMVWHPRFTDVDAERQVVLEEIAMYEDDPQDKVFDLLGTAVFGSHPLGRAIIGSADVVANTPVDDIRAFHRARYVPSNVVVAAAGALEHERVVEMVQAALPDWDGPAPGPPEPAPPFEPRVLFERKDTEQYHVCLGGPGIARNDERRFALRVLDTIIGGTASSRLFQEIREKRGLAYAVSSFNSQFAETGEVGLYLGTRGDNLAAALEVVAHELARLSTEPLPSDELERSKENAKGRLALSLESTVTRMNRLGSATLTGMPMLSMDELVARVDAVSADDVTALAREFFVPDRLSAAAIGPDEDRFRSALSALSLKGAPA
jgi:predicted Zn-dependent peptidase